MFPNCFIGKIFPAPGAEAKAGMFRWWLRALVSLALSAALLTATVADTRLFVLGWLVPWPVFYLLEQKPGLARRAGLGLLWLFLISQFGFPYAVATANRHLQGQNLPAAWLMGTTLGVVTSLRYLVFMLAAAGPRLTWPAVWSACELFIWQMMPVYGGVHVLGDRPFVQWAEWLGAPGLSWLWFSLSLALYESLRGRFKPHYSLVPFLLIHLIGGWSLLHWQGRVATAPRRSLAVIQGNLPPALAQTMEVAEQSRAQMVEQTRRFLSTLQQKPEVVIWPEASLPLLEHTRLERFGLGIPLIFTDFEPGSRAGYVVARLLDAQDRSLGVYRKRKLILMGEWRPWDLEGSLQVGQEDVLLPSPAGAVLPLVCFEGLWPGFAASFHRNTGARAEWLVYLGSESSFGSDLCCRQSLHLAMLRSVELRRPMVRANNSGVSGWIDSSGRLHQATRPFTRQAVLLEVAMPPAGWTLYARWGDLPLWLLILLGLSRWRRRAAE